jgi:hypothetical protein
MTLCFNGSQCGFAQLGWALHVQAMPIACCTPGQLTQFTQQSNNALK